MVAVATMGLPTRAAVLASRLARACRVGACRASRLAGHLLGLDPLGDFAALVGVVFPLAEDRAELERRTARHRATEPAPIEEAARVRAFVDLVGERRFPVDDFVLWDADAATYETLLEAIPFVRYGWCDDDLHADPGEHRPGHDLLRALAAAPDDGAGGIAGRGALLDHLARHVPARLLAPLAGGGLAADTIQARLGGTRFAPAADFARWLAGDTGLICLDYSDEDGVAEAPWSRHNVAILAAQWPRARALLAGIDALATWLEADPTARFAELVAAAGLAPGPVAPESPP